MALTQKEKEEILRERGLSSDDWQVVEPAPPQPLTPSLGPQSSAMGAFGRSAARGVLPGLGAALGASLPAYLLGPEIGIPATIATTLLGGGLGAIGAEKGQEAALSTFAPSWKKSLDKQAALDAEQHRVATIAGGVASALPTFELNPMGAARGLNAAYRLGRGGLSEAEQAAARTAAYGTGAQLGLGAATGAINPLLEGRTPTMEDVGMGLGQAALLGRHRGWLGNVPGLGFMAHPQPRAIGSGMYPDAIGPVGPSDTPLGPAEPPQNRINRTLGIGMGLPPNAADQQALLVAANAQTAPRSQTFYVSPLGGVAQGDFGVHEVQPRIQGEPGPVTSGAIPLPSPQANLDPAVATLERQLEEIRALADDKRLPISKRVDAQRAIGEIEQKMAAYRSEQEEQFRTAAQAAAVARKPVATTVYVGPQGEARVGDYPRVIAVGAPESYGRRATQQGPAILGQPGGPRPPLVASLGPEPRSREITPKEQPFGPVLPEASALHLPGTYPPTAAQLGTFESRTTFPPGRSPAQVEPGKQYNVVPPESLKAEFPLAKSSASPENIAAVQQLQKERETHAAQPIVEQVQPNIGIQPRENLRKNKKEVRKEKGTTTSSGGQLRGETPGGIAPSQLPAFTPESASEKLAAKASVEQSVNERLNAMLRASGADPGIKFQEATKLAEQLTPAELLSHPVNADLLAATERVAERHNVTLKATDEKIVTPEQKLAAGSADIARRLARYHGQLATVDTGLHELGHIFLDDLRTSAHPAERALYDRGVDALRGDEEALTQAVGLRSTDLLKARIEGNTLVRLQHWLRDFWAAAKNKFGQANTKDLINLLARRMVDGEMVARGERPALQSSTWNIRYQEAAPQRDAARTTESAAALHDFTIPFLRPIMENVRRIPKFGEPLYNAFSAMRDTKNDVLGRYKNQANLILEKADPWYSVKKPNSVAIATRMFNERENANYVGPELSPKADEAYRQLKELLIQAGEEANKRGIKVLDGDVFREIILFRRYISHMMSGEAAYVMRQQPGSDAFNKLRSDYLGWVMKGGLKGPAGGLSSEEASAAWEASVRSLAGPTSNENAGTSSYGPLERAQGLGLPDSMREKNLSTILNRYFQRYAQKTAWYEHVEKDTPENAVVRTLLDETDQFGSKQHNATHLADGTKAEIVGTDDVKAAVKDLRQNYDRSDLIVDAFDRLFKSGMMQTLTGFADFTGGIANAAQHLKLSDYLVLTPRAVNRLAEGIRAGLRMNVIQTHSARLQYGSEGATDPSQMMGRRIDNIVKVTNALSDGIYRITGRDAFERWSRGLLMSMGMVKTEDVLGRIRAGAHDASDVKWLDTFLERGKWEALLKDGSDQVTTQLQEQVAAKFVQSVQGSHDAFGLPAWAMSGKLAPFFTLGRWNLEKANNFTKYVLNPMKRGDFAPFLKISGLAVLGGEAIHLFRQLVTGRKSQDANWDEIMAAGGDGLDYRLLASMAFTGYSGAIADILKQAYDIGKGNQAQGFRFPVVAAVQGFANRGAQFAQAMEEGENPFELLPQLVTTLGKDNIQMARALTRYASEDEAQNVDRANALRDLKVFRQAAGIPVPPAIGQQANPFLNPLKKEFQRTTELSQAIGIAPQLFRQAVARAAGDPERLRALLRNYAAASSDTMPSLLRQPRQFKAYADWLTETQGGPASSSAVSAYLRKTAIDQVKRGLVPQL